MSCSILNVDDREINRAARAEVLSSEGYVVVDAASGQLALELFESERPDLVLLAVDLPDFTGVEICRRLRALHSDIPAVIITISAADTAGADRAHVLEAGADGYLVEPVEPELLRATVQALLRVREAERKARENEQFLRLGLAAARMGTWEIDPIEGRLRWSDHMEGLFGLPAGSFDGRLESVVRHIHPDDRDRVVADALMSLENSAAEQIDFRVVWPDGTVRWLAIQGQVLVRRHSKTSLIGVALDITERKEAEEQLRYQLNLNETITSKAAEAIFLRDKTGRTTFSNAAATQMLGWTQEELLGEVLHDRVHYKHRDESPFPIHECPIERVGITHKTLKNYEDWFIHKDGSWVAVECSNAPIVENGEVAAAVLVVHDITQRKRFEEELKRSNEDLSRFAHTASHDLQEPLRSVAIYSELLTRQNYGKLDAQSEEFLAQIISGTRRMQALISDLLIFSEAHRVDRESQRPIQLMDAVEHALSNLKQAIEESGAIITHEELPSVVGNEAHLAQVFQNLIGNAIKYRKAESSPEVRITCQERREDWLIKVADNGMGFEQRYSEQIFEPFKRLHTREIAGTGLGLAITRKIVDRYGGRIWAESERDAGSSFCFTLLKGRADNAAERGD
jgi:PAS domain S-box-containing protein